MLMIIKFQMKHTRTLILVIHTLFIYLFSFISLKNTLTHLHSNNNWVKFHIIPEMTSHRLSVVKFKIKISSYFLNKALS